MEVIVNASAPRPKTYHTKYNTGDVVKVYKLGNPRMIETAKFYTDSVDENGHNRLEERPQLWTIYSMDMCLDTGAVTYHLTYSDESCLFPMGNKGVTEDMIVEKVSDIWQESARTIGN